MVECDSSMQLATEKINNGSKKANNLIVLWRGMNAYDHLKNFIKVTIQTLHLIVFSFS